MQNDDKNQYLIAADKGGLVVISLREELKIILKVEIKNNTIKRIYNINMCGLGQKLCVLCNNGGIIYIMFRSFFCMG